MQHPQIGDARPPTVDEYPLLTLPEQRRSRQSPAPSSLVVERSLGTDSHRTSVGFPRDRRGIALDSQPATPKLKMPAEHISPPGPPGDPTHDAPIPVSRTDDLERGNKEFGLSPSRAYLPDSASMHSHRTDTAGGDQGNADDANSEYPWGPKHPCFPHPNPHVPLNSPLYHSTRIIRISRDWMAKGDLAPTFQNLYPEVLDPLIEEDAFRTLIKYINDTLIDAFDPLTFRAFLDAVMGVATFWLWDDVGLTKVKRKLAELEKWIERWNRDVGEKEGVKIIPLRRTGYMTVSRSFL